MPSLPQNDLRIETLKKLAGLDYDPIKYAEELEQVRQEQMAKDLEEDHKYKLKIKEWVRVRIFFLPFFSHTLGEVKEREHKVYITPFGMIRREYYKIETWDADQKYCLPAWRLKIDKQRKLEHKMIGANNVPG